MAISTTLTDSHTNTNKFDSTLPIDSTASINPTNFSTPKLHTTSTYISSTQPQDLTSPEIDNSFETTFFIALFSSVGIIAGTVLTIGIVFYYKSKKFSVIHPKGGKNEFIELK
jgi:hypothetical protein